MTRTETSLAGALLDRRYRVEDLIARGGMSSVYRGVDTRLDRPVAVKVMDSRFAGDRSFLDRFEREARSAARLHHPHVVAVHDQGFDTSAGADNPRAFLVMELVDGGTLRDLIEDRGRLDVALAVTIAEQVLSALAAAHAAGLVHRDIKPENVLIGSMGEHGGTVKVADFGLVRAAASAGTTSTSVILGTVAYLSPEQVSTGAASERSDVYSTGILLYEMLTGQVPYRGDTALSVAYRHVNDDVPAPSTVVSDLPSALDDLVVRATRRDPAARPADAADFLSELQRVRAELGLRSASIPFVPPPANSAGGGPAEADSELTVPALPAVAPDAGPRGTQALPRAAAEQLEHAGDRESEPADGVPRRRAPLAVLALVVLVLLGGVGAGVWWFSSGRYVDVPSLAGLSREEAETALRQAQLTPVFTEERHNTTPSGTVISSDPDSGARALQGDEVTVVVSLGRPVVPDVRAGASVEEAERAIKAVQLKPRMSAETDDYSAEVPEGAVITLRPQPGSQANVGDAVTIVRSKGPRPIPVPDVTGMSTQEAFQALRVAGFEPYEAGAEFAADVPSGHVVRTEPANGGTAEHGSRVGVVVSNAVEVPSVVGRRTEKAVQILRDAGFKVSGDDSRGLISFVVDQSPAGGEFVEPGTTVSLSVIP
ncbi:Stk1 family PASTA domain-containing Ser/Thr kinase [Saccharomonospora xinjiangensis]|uniref:Stk1 family PASTA domain-containing Ser/Thr kinase n=1 Tax=Saccharomonospora xinjiangensis TaxID=75294 RepID=UPI00106F419B|nr:Stk1 family PASTA domain-containing Ser/Thr kinase [Saccharomonospora xinjiangensis]QBQ61412.1 Serine/threonine-protein kinase PK-1 [Saccharomonospora xinjiangensis]